MPYVDASQVQIDPLPDVGAQQQSTPSPQASPAQTPPQDKQAEAKAIIDKIRAKGQDPHKLLSSLAQSNIDPEVQADIRSLLLTPAPKPAPTQKPAAPKLLPPGMGGTPPKGLPPGKSALTMALPLLDPGMGGPGKGAPPAKQSVAPLGGIANWLRQQYQQAASY
jgi:hypothetical protein